MATQARTEPIRFEREVQGSDGFNGTIGRPGIVCTTLAEVWPLKPTRQLEANQETLRQGYRMRIWAKKDFEPAINDIILYRDERLALTGYQYEDMSRRKYLLTVLELAPGGESPQ